MILYHQKMEVDHTMKLPPILVEKLVVAGLSKITVGCRSTRTNIMVIGLLTKAFSLNVLNVGQPDKRLKGGSGNPAAIISLWLRATSLTGPV